MKSAKKIYAAALQFNTLQVLTTYYKTADKNLPLITETVETVSSKIAHERRKAKYGTKPRKRRGKKYADKDYDPNCNEPDMDDKTYAFNLEKQQEKMREYITNRGQTERETRKQARSRKWRRVRKDFITASFTRRICHM